MSIDKPTRLTSVIAKWCPHCYPLSVENSKKLAQELGIPCRILDIDNENEEKIADRMVNEYGDDSVDYLIPQIFLEFESGTIRHIFTGFSEGTEVTKRHWDDLLNSDFVSGLKGR